MTTRRKTTTPTLRITQVRSIIGNQERVKRVVTSGLGLGRIGQTVVLPDNSYTRGMIAKTAHIVRFEEVAASAHAAKPETAVPDAVDKLVDSVVAAPVKAPRKKKAVEAEGTEQPAQAPARASRARAAAKDEE